MDLPVVEDTVVVVEPLEISEDLVEEVEEDTPTPVGVVAPAADGEVQVTVAGEIQMAEVAVVVMDPAQISTQAMVTHLVLPRGGKRTQTASALCTTTHKLAFYFASSFRTHLNRFFFQHFSNIFTQ